MVAILVGEHQLAVQRAWRIAGLSRTAHYRPPVEDPGRDTAVITALQAVVQTSPRWGFWKCFDRLRLLGHRWNHKHVYRVYRALRLNLVRRTTRRIPTRIRQPLDADSEPLETPLVRGMLLHRSRKIDALPLQVSQLALIDAQWNGSGYGEKRQDLEPEGQEIRRLFKIFS